jgi:hypothetical protein
MTNYADIQFIPIKDLLPFTHGQSHVEYKILPRSSSVYPMVPHFTHRNYCWHLHLNNRACCRRLDLKFGTVVDEMAGCMGLSC